MKCLCCEKEFTPTGKMHSYQIYCSPKCNRKIQFQRYRAKPENTAKHREKERLRYQNSLEYQVRVKDRVRQYSTTPNGIVSRMKYRATQRPPLTNPELFAMRTISLRSLKESCALCNKPYERGHIIDHILALCNGGKDELSNYQPVCRECHYKKNGQDYHIWRVNHPEFKPRLGT